MKDMMRLFSSVLLLFFINSAYSQYVNITNPQKPAEYRVMSFNIRRGGSEPEDRYLWKNRKENVAKMFSAFKPDIIGLQEALKSQISDITRMLGSFYKWFGKGRKNPHNPFRPDKSEYTPLFYNKNKFDVVDHGTFWLNPKKQPGKTGWGATVNRICTWGKLKDKRNGNILLIFNTHLDHRSAAAREGGLDLIIREARSKIVSQSDALVVMGDLNEQLAPGTGIHKVINNSQRRMFDSKELAKKRLGASGTAFAKGWLGDLHTIDFIFVNDKELFDIKQYLVIDYIDKVISDHNAIAIDFNLRKQPNVISAPKK